MTPNYALSLSFSGISLLTRAASVGGPAEGWYTLGKVPLDTDDLPGALAQLRAEAVPDLEMDGPETKLILPNEQIKFLSIGDDGSAPEAQAEAALAGATPYDVADLVFDVQRVGGLLNIAAVARETLTEAEAFARDNRFVPLSFVAMAPKGAFEGEPFFGPTEAALTQLTPGVAIERDDRPIVILDGPPPAPAPAPAPDPEDVPQPSAAPEDIAEESPAEETAARDAAAPTSKAEPQEAQDAAQDQTQTETAPGAPAAPKSAPATAPGTASIPVTLDYVERSDGSTPRQPTAAPKATAAVPGASKPLTTSPQAAQAAEAAPTMAFASLRAERGSSAGTPEARAPSPTREGQTPPLQGAQPGARITPKPLGAGTVANPLAPSRDAPAPQSTETESAQKTGTKIPRGPSFANALKARALASFASRRSAGGMAESPAPALEAKSAAPAPAAPAIDQQTANETGGSAAATVSSVLARAQTGLGRGVGFVSRRTSEIRASRAARAEERAAAAPAARAQGGTAAALTAGNKMDEADRMTVFGARKSNPNRPVGGKPRFLGLMLTAALLLFLLGVAAWASVFIDDGISRFFSDDTQAVETDTALTQPSIPALSAPEAEPQAGAGPDTPSLQIPAGTKEAAVSAVAPSSAPSASTPLTLPQIAPEETEAPEVETALAVGVPAIGTPPEAAASVAGLSKPMGKPVSDEAARTLYAATGIWQRAPLPPAELRQGLLGDLHIASLDGVISARAQAPRPAPLTDTALTAVTPSPAARSLAAPSLTAPSTPAQSQQAALTAPRSVDPATDAAPGLNAPVQANPALRAFRPLARPASVAEAAPRALSPAEAALAKVRPLARPKALEQTQAAEDAAQKELVAKALAEAAIAAAAEDARTAAEAEVEVEAAPESQLALATSTAPKPRPANIKALVRRADREAESQATQVAAVKPKTVKPVAPSKGSVTKNATQANAINLRKVNLIGVYGKPSDRRALVRLANGRFKKVKVGDRIDGGRILAISDGQLRYQKGGRNLTLKMPQG